MDDIDNADWDVMDDEYPEPDKLDILVAHMCADADFGGIRSTREVLETIGATDEETDELIFNNCDIFMY